MIQLRGVYPMHSMVQRDLQYMGRYLASSLPEIGRHWTDHLVLSKTRANEEKFFWLKAFAFGSWTRSGMKVQNGGECRLTLLDIRATWKFTRHIDDKRWWPKIHATIEHNENGAISQVIKSTTTHFSPSVSAAVTRTLELAPLPAHSQYSIRMFLAMASTAVAALRVVGLGTQWSRETINHVALLIPTWKSLALNKNKVTLFEKLSSEDRTCGYFNHVPAVKFFEEQGLSMSTVATVSQIWNVKSSEALVIAER